MGPFLVPTIVMLVSDLKCCGIYAAAVSWYNFFFKKNKEKRILEDCQRADAWLFISMQFLGQRRMKQSSQTGHVI